MSALGLYSQLAVGFRCTARIRSSSINTICWPGHGNRRLRIVGRRGRSGVRSGSSPGERVCVSARPEKTRNERPHRPSARDGIGKVTGTNGW